jgi:hypothetical protein
VLNTQSRYQRPTKLIRSCPSPLPPPPPFLCSTLLCSYPTAMKQWTAEPHLAASKEVTADWHCPPCAAKIRLISITGGSLDSLVSPLLTRCVGSETSTSDSIRRSIARPAQRSVEVVQKSEMSSMKGSPGSGQRGMSFLNMGSCTFSTSHVQETHVPLSTPW